MSKFTRKRGLPAALVLAMGIIGALAVFVAVAAVQPGATHAQADPCEGPFASLFPQCQDGGGNGGGGGGTPPPTTPTPTTPPTGPAADAQVTLDGKTTKRSSSGSSNIQLSIRSLPMDMAVGSSIVLYLEDDFQEPDSIPMSSVYLVATNGPSNTAMDARTTGRGARVYVTSPVKLKNSDYFTADKDDIAIRVLVPDMCTNATDECEGPNGLHMGQNVSVVIESDSGIKNPSEAGEHSTGYTLLGPSDTEIPGAGKFTTTNTVFTVAKISLSDVDNKRGYEMTVTGSGFNNGTSAAVYVLANAMRDHMMWWEGLDCAGMLAAVGSSEDPAGSGPDKMKYCGHFLNTPPTNITDPAKELSADAKTALKDMFLCERIVRNGTKVGGALVGSDDKVTVTFEITAPTFQPGNVNYLCMVDGEGRASNTDVEDFNLEPSIKVVPASVATGDTVNVFAQDYQNIGQSWTQLKIAGQTVAPNGDALSTFVTDTESISSTGEGSVTFEVPGGLEGVLRIDARWGMPDGTPAKCDIDAPNPCISKDSKITIAGAELIPSKTDVRPNETLTITGNGFGTQTCIPAANITMDDVAVIVHDDSLADRCGGTGVEVSNSGQFVATIILWPAARNGGTNPSLIPGTHSLDVEDNEEYSASVSLTIAEPTIMVTPDVAGPRDYITITGENWPVDNLDNSLSEPINVVIEDYQNGRSYPLYADSVGRITVEHRVHRRVAIPDTVQVKANYDGGKVVKIGSFAVPASTITVTPGEGQPGDMVTLTAASMPVYTEADYVEIGGTTYQDPGVNTDRDGNITVEDVLIPGLDPGVYSVVINVDGTIAIGEVKVLAESSAAGAPAALPGAVEELGDNLVAIFHFDDVGKVWSFYDPRPEFAELNTLTELVNGEAYWILVNETVEDVVLNNKVRSLTCRGDDCWNLEVW